MLSQNGEIRQEPDSGNHKLRIERKSSNEASPFKKIGATVMHSDIDWLSCITWSTLDLYSALHRFNQ